VSGSRKIAIDSFALALSSDFFKKMLENELQRNITTTIIIPDIEPEIMDKIVEYIYLGCVR
jgi:BTB/POZ domain